MTDNYGDAIQRVQADQAKLAAMSPEEREAEQQRRAELFRAKNRPPTFKDKAKGWIVWLGIAAVVIGVLFIVGTVLYGGTTSVEDLETGDCFIFNPEDGGDRIDTPDCTEPHDAQIYHDFRPGSMTSSEKTSKCIENSQRIDMTPLNVVSDYSAELGSFDVGRENSSAASHTYCWIKFPNNVMASVVTLE